MSTGQSLGLRCFLLLWAVECTELALVLLLSFCFHEGTTGTHGAQSTDLQGNGAGALIQVYLQAELFLN